MAAAFPAFARWRAFGRGGRCPPEDDDKRAAMVKNGVRAGLWRGPMADPKTTVPAASATGAPPDAAGSEGPPAAGDSEAAAAPSPEDREARIRHRAYAIWESEGRPDGREQAHWDQAERESDQG